MSVNDSTKTTMEGHPYAMFSNFYLQRYRKVGVKFWGRTSAYECV